MIRIPIELLEEVMYFLNDWIRLLGYGREHARLARLVWNFFKAGVFETIRLEKYYYIARVIENFRRIERIEKEKG
jgi:hypothetical protein